MSRCLREDDVHSFCVPNCDRADRLKIWINMAQKCLIDLFNFHLNISWINQCRRQWSVGGALYECADRQISSVFKNEFESISREWEICVIPSDGEKETKLWRFFVCKVIYINWKCNKINILFHRLRTIRSSVSHSFFLSSTFEWLFFCASPVTHNHTHKRCNVSSRIRIFPWFELTSRS